MVAHVVALLRAGVAPASIAVISPYAAQVRVGVGVRDRIGLGLGIGMRSGLG